MSFMPFNILGTLAPGPALHRDHRRRDLPPEMLVRRVPRRRTGSCGPDHEGAGEGWRRPTRDTTGRRPVAQGLPIRAGDEPADGLLRDRGRPAGVWPSWAVGPQSRLDDVRRSEARAGPGRRALATIGPARSTGSRGLTAARCGWNVTDPPTPRRS